MVNMLNSILIEGNVVKQAEMTKAADGSVKTTFQISSTRLNKVGEEIFRETSFIDIETTGKLAESCYANCNEKRGVRIVGRVKQDRWVDGEGNNLSRVKVVAEHVEFKPMYRDEEETPEE